jgi:hypothetical protein
MEAIELTPDELILKEWVDKRDALTEALNLHKSSVPFPHGTKVEVDGYPAFVSWSRGQMELRVPTSKGNMGRAFLDTERIWGANCGDYPYKRYGDGKLGPVGFRVISFPPDYA